ncbi:MAG TPA: rhodanese-like domain-containing protein [Candidatus Thermoplasmatota archaeon]|nr:rhodanese-like domain-containing protein [Candidatus Thermoplasmatota archaeon]
MSPAPLVDAPEAARRFREGHAILLDVREPFELEAARVEGALHIPMREIVARVGELPKDKPILVMCHSGMRSQRVADWLQPQGYDASNIAGGIDAWADQVDPSVGKY